MISEEVLDGIEQRTKEMATRPSASRFYSRDCTVEMLGLIAEIREQRATIERLTKSYEQVHKRLVELTEEAPAIDRRAELREEAEERRAMEPLDVMKYGGIDCEDIV